MSPAGQGGTRLPQLRRHPIGVGRAPPRATRSRSARRRPAPARPCGHRGRRAPGRPRRSRRRPGRTASSRAQKSVRRTGSPLFDGRRGPGRCRSSAPARAPDRRRDSACGTGRAPAPRSARASSGTVATAASTVSVRIRGRTRSIRTPPRRPRAPDAHHQVGQPLRGRARVPATLLGQQRRTRPRSGRTSRNRGAPGRGSAARGTRPTCPPQAHGRAARRRRPGSPAGGRAGRRPGRRAGDSAYMPATCSAQHHADDPQHVGVPCMPGILPMCTGVIDITPTITRWPVATAAIARRAPGAGAEWHRPPSRRPPRRPAAAGRTGAGQPAAR